jgi:transposase
MYPRVKKVRRGDQVHQYVQLVEGRREGGKVRQRVVATLGRLDELKASGQLERWAGAFARLDPPPPGTRRQVGPLLLVAHYLDRLGLTEVIDEIAPMRGQSLLTHGEVMAVLVANRLCAPAPLYDIASWASSAAIAELFDVPAGLLNDDRLGRALDAVAAHAEKLRAQLLLRVIERFQVDAGRLHLDLTAVRFAGDYEHSTLVRRGWAADRTIKRQVKTLQAATKSGVSLYFRAHPGATSELPAFMAGIETLAAVLPPGLVVVADSGLGYVENLCTLDTSKVGFVVPLRADTGWARRFAEQVPAGLAALKRLPYCSQREQHLPVRRRTIWKGLLRPYPVQAADGTTHGLRAAYIYSSEEAATVREARQRALIKAEEALARIRNGCGGQYYKTKTQVEKKVAQIVPDRQAGMIRVQTGETPTGKPTITWSRDQDAIAAAGALDGLYALATNLADPPGRRLSALDVLTIYKDQWIDEQRHRDLKQTLRVRPLFLHNDTRIEALIAIIGVALLIFGLIEAELRAALGSANTLPGILPEGRAAKPTGRAALAAFSDLGLTYTTAGLILDPLNPIQRIILALLNISLPWPEGRPPAQP